MDEKQAELMRALTAAQAALWDVVDAPEQRDEKYVVAQKRILAAMIWEVDKLALAVTGTKYVEY